MLTIASAGGISACSQKDNAFAMQAPWINDAEFLGYFVAMHNNYYENAGIKFKYLSGGPEKISDHILLAKKAEIALTNPETTVALIINENAPFKIIGTQYQKSPLGVVSLDRKAIRTPQELIGKKLAVPAANRITVAAFLKLNKIASDQITIVPYNYDPSILLQGQCDATIDFVTNVPFVIEQAGEKAASFLLYDFGLKVFMDTVVVRTDMLAERRKEVVGFLKASRSGWSESFKDPKKYISAFMSSHFKGTSRNEENEMTFQKNQQPLIESPAGIFSMSDTGMRECIASLNEIGLKATISMFDTSVLQEV